MSANEVEKYVSLTYNCFRTCIHVVDLFDKQLQQIAPAQQYLEAIKELDIRPSAVVSCERLADEIRSVMMNIVSTLINAYKNINTFIKATQRLFAIFLKTLEKSTLESYEAQRAHLIRKFDDGFVKWNGLKDTVRKSFSKIQLLVGKVGAREIYLSPPIRLMVSESKAAGVVIGKGIPELSKMFAELARSLNECQVKIHNGNENFEALSGTTDDTQELVPDDDDAYLDYVMSTVKNLLAPKT